jgi:hypothetical protein
MLLNKEAFMTNHRMLESRLAWSLESEIVKIDQELVVVIPHGVHQGTI